jgi:hypothetical protein
MLKISSSGFNIFINLDKKTKNCRLTQFKITIDQSQIKILFLKKEN